MKETITNKPEPYLKKKDVCKIFGVTVRTIENWQRNGNLPFIKIGRTVYFLRSQIDNRAKEQTILNTPQ